MFTNKCAQTDNCTKAAKFFDLLIPRIQFLQVWELMTATAENDLTSERFAAAPQILSFHLEDIYM